MRLSQTGNPDGCDESFQKCILDQTKKAIETEEIEARVSELERAAEAQKKKP